MAKSTNKNHQEPDTSNPPTPDTQPPAPNTQHPPPPNTRQQLSFEPLRKDLQLFEDKKKQGEGSDWILFDPVADKYFRIEKKEHLILSFFNSSSTAEELLDKVKKVDSSIDSKDINTVISFLHSNNLLLSTHIITENKLISAKMQKDANSFNRLLHSYLFFRIPVWKPDKFLSDSLYIVQAICNKWILFALSLFAFVGYISLIVHWNEFETTIIDSLNYAGAVKYGITVVILKFIHEFAHAYAAKNAGVRVRRFGIGFIVFFPRFFTDITDSWRLGGKKSKLLIDAAGILLELMIGGLAVLFWVYLGPGIAKTIAYYVFAVSIINTVLVNGNPFIRYDGYYLLMDFLNIDNLQQRSRLLISKAIRENFFGIETPLPFEFTGWRKCLIIIYGISAFVYRIFLYTGIILIVYYKFTKFVGIILACIEVYLLVLKPFYREITTIIKLKSKAEGKKIIVTFSAFIILLLIFFIPLPWSVSIPAVVGSSKNNIIYVKESGFLKSINPAKDLEVKRGEQLFLLKNPFNEYREKIVEAQLKVKEVELDRLKNHSENKFTESLSSKIQQIKHLKDNLKEMARKRELLSIKSPITGTFVLFDWRMKPGKWLGKGEPIGEVFSDKNTLIYAYADEESVRSFHLGEKVKIYLEGDIRSFEGQVVSINPIPTKEWTPSPLLDTAGGPLPVLRKESFSSFTLKNYYYQLRIDPEKKYKDLKFSRTGTVFVREYSSIGLSFIRTVISTLQRELSF